MRKYIEIEPYKQLLTFDRNIKIKNYIDYPEQYNIQQDQSKNLNGCNETATPDPSSVVK
jgi:hypothetical protein